MLKTLLATSSLTLAFLMLPVGLPSSELGVSGAQAADIIIDEDQGSGTGTNGGGDADTTADDDDD
jgi:hypothetical protein